MKIRIVTLHAMHNPGSVLQAFALQKYLSKAYESKVIDYQPEYIYTEGSRIKLVLKKILYGRKYSSRKKKFISFIKSNIDLTEKISSYEELENKELDADVYISGSDQLWNSDYPCGNDPAFYLAFVKEKKKISYSTSVGKAEIDAKNCSILEKYLPGYDSISVREESTARQLTEMLHRNVEWVCDPVFLLSGQEYMSFINDESPSDKKYVMVYLSPKSEVIDKCIDHYKEKGYRIILVGGMTKRFACDEHIKDVGPADFLNYIYHADVVISTSFHATAFSIIFHKDFISQLPPKNGERIVSILRLIRLSNRGVQDTIDFRDVEKVVDWNYVDSKIRTYVENSKEYLKKAIG